MHLNQAISMRIKELLQEKHLTQYQLYLASGVPQSTISAVINCVNPSVKLRILYELCQGFQIDLIVFFNSPLFENQNITD